MIEDAVKFVKKAQSSPNTPQYDYIVHDVFTGGAEPADLFTYEFLSGLHSLLKEDGAIAIVSFIKATSPPNQLQTNEWNTELRR